MRALHRPPIDNDHSTVAFGGCTRALAIGSSRENTSHLCSRRHSKRPARCSSGRGHSFSLLGISMMREACWRSQQPCFSCIPFLPPQLLPSAAVASFVLPSAAVQPMRPLRMGATVLVVSLRTGATVLVVSLRIPFFCALHRSHYYHQIYLIYFGVGGGDDGSGRRRRCCRHRCCRRVLKSSPSQPPSQSQPPPLQLQVLRRPRWSGKDLRREGCLASAPASFAMTPFWSAPRSMIYSILDAKKRRWYELYSPAGSL